MQEVGFEKAFSKFIDGDECEMVSEFIFQVIRAAFKAGWAAAKNDKPDTLFIASKSGHG